VVKNRAKFHWSRTTKALERHYYKSKAIKRKSTEFVEESVQTSLLARVSPKQFGVEPDNQAESHNFGISPSSVHTTRSLGLVVGDDVETDGALVEVE
jgi:hypothetical protein